MGMKNSKLYHHLSLVFILVWGVLLFYLSKGYPQTQFLIVIIISGLYVSWGIVHHYLEGDLHPRVVIEYILLAAIAIALLRGAIIG